MHESVEKRDEDVNGSSTEKTTATNLTSISKDKKTATKKSPTSSKSSSNNSDINAESNSTDRPTSLRFNHNQNDCNETTSLKNRVIVTSNTGPNTVASSVKTQTSLNSVNNPQSIADQLRQSQQKPKRVKLKTSAVEDLQCANFLPSYAASIAANSANSSECGSKNSKLISAIPSENELLNAPTVDLKLAAELDLLYVPKNCAEQVELFAKYVWDSGWKAMPHHALPHWLRDNDFLLKGHRPPLPSVKACFKSMFRIHTETGNIWTHLIGSISFIAVAVYFLSRPSIEIKMQEKFVFGAFFLGAIICLVCSTLFHTFCCFSPRVSKLFNKIDYCGISVLTMGSFVPWLYYAFYCEPIPKIAYLVLISILGSACIVVSLWDKFSEPQFRAIRAGMFIALGLSGLIPAVHYILTVGSQKAFNVGALGWLVLMAVLYIVGACLYAARIPERLFPGRFDIWFQSHQIFHVFVLVAAYVHYHGITKLASYRLTLGDCLTAHTESDYSFEF